MTPPLKTPQAARQLNIPVYVLTGLFRYGKMNPPGKDSSGDYFWTPEDLERARQALARGRRRQGVEGAVTV